MSLTPGTKIGAYEITATLGAGGMGEVYRARDRRLKREVALKVLPSSLAADRDRIARFEREAEVLAALNHPHIASLYGVEQADGMLALVMELVEGEDLSARVVRGPLPIDEALTIAREVAAALEAAHERGLLATTYYAGFTSRGLMLRGYDVAPDGERFLMIKGNAVAESRSVVTIALNWSPAP